LGEIEEYFASTLTPGDTFLIGGRSFASRACARMTVEVSARRPDRSRAWRAFGGGSFRASGALTRPS
jgi:ATP-dependent Lhr-like helicase